MSLTGKERLREGEETGSEDRGRKISREFEKFRRSGLGPRDAFAAAIENNRRERNLKDF